MASTLEALMEQLNRYQPYQAMTKEQIEQAAQNRYQAVYDQKRLSAQQAYETSDAALARELASRQDTYTRERERSAAQTEEAYRQADRHALSRGMQRSSYNSANLMNIDLAGDAALGEIGRRQAQAEAEVGEQRTLLSTQLATQLAGYDAQQRSDVLGYMDELEAREYERAVESANTYNELAMKLYEYQHQLEQEAAEQARWQAEFNAKYSTPAKSSGGGSKKKTTTTTTTTTTTKKPAGGAGGKLSTPKMLDR